MYSNATHCQGDGFMDLSSLDETIERTDMPAKPFQMRCSDEFWRGVDDWRRLQTDMPNRAEAIRRLVALGLRADPPTQRLAPVKAKGRARPDE
jgi:hypothetical protein